MTTTLEIVPLTIMITTGTDKAEICEIEAGIEIDLHRKETRRSGYDAGSGPEYTLGNCFVNCRKYIRPKGGTVLSGRWVEDWRPSPQAFVGYITDYAESEAGRRDIECFIREEI